MNFLFGVVGGVLGSFFVILLIAKYEMAQKKKAMEKAVLEVKGMEDELKLMMTTANSPKFKAGDHLKTKEIPLQPWEKEQPPSIVAEVLEVGNGAYRMKVEVMGYATQTTITFQEAHSAFEADVSYRAKPKFSVVPGGNA